MKASAKIRRRLRLWSKQVIPDKLLVVRIKALFRLSSEKAGFDHAPEQWRGQVALLPKLLVQRSSDCSNGVQADQISERKWAHRVRATKPHGVVDILGNCASAFFHSYRVQDERYNQ